MCGAGDGQCPTMFRTAAKYECGAVRSERDVWVLSVLGGDVSNNAVRYGADTIGTAAGSWEERQ